MGLLRPRPKSGLGLLLALMGPLLLLWNCDPTGNPTPPPLHRIGTETVWNSEVYQDSTEYGPVLKTDTLRRVFSTDTLPGEGNRPELNSYRVTWEIRHFQVRERLQHRLTWKLGQQCKVDSGPRGSTAVPVLSDCKEVQSQTGDSVSGPFPDTVWTQTTYEVVLQSPELGPTLGQLAPSESLKVFLDYPDVHGPGVSVYNPEAHALEILQDGKNFDYRFSALRDSLYPSWPGGNANTGLIPGTLGTLQGILGIKNLANGRQTSYPYALARRWWALVPKGKTLNQTWSFQGKPDLLALSGFGENLFSLTTNPADKDSLVQLKSLFTLKGDFRVSLKIDRPLGSSGGCFIAALFTGQTSTFVEYSPKSGNRGPSYNLYADTTFGLSYNAKGLSQGITYPVTTYGPKGSETINNQFIPAFSELLLVRSGHIYSISVKDMETGKTETLTPPQNGFSILPESLRIVFLVGNLTSAPFAVEFKDFAITQGQVVLP